MILMYVGLKITKEMLYGWITTKMNGWEKPIYKLVRKLRDNEMNTQKKMNNMKSILVAIFGATANAIIIAIFLPTYYVYGAISLYEAFTILGFMAGVGYDIC